jgi:hypothetical protein
MTKSLGDATPLALTAAPSDVLRVAGACVDQGVEPTSVCCQETATTCSDSVRTSVLGLYIARHDCAAATGLDVTKAHFNSVCGSDGVCTAQ